MRENFPSADLLTSRSVNHGIGSDIVNGKIEDHNEDPVCDGLIIDYFRDGEVGFVDGHVCESDPVGDSCTINDIVNGHRVTPVTHLPSPQAPRAQIYHHLPCLLLLVNLADPSGDKK